MNILTLTQWIPAISDSLAETIHGYAWLIASITTFAVVMQTMPTALRRRALLPFGVIITGYLLGRVAIAFALLHLMVYAAVSWRMREPAEHFVSRARWTAVALCLLLLALLVVPKYHTFQIAGVPLIFYSMWATARMYSFIRDSGVGKIKALDGRTFILWVTFPMTYNGTFLSYGNFALALANRDKVTRAKIHWREFAAGGAMLVAGLVMIAFNEGWRYAPSAETLPFPLARKLACAIIFVPWSCYLQWGGFVRVMRGLSPAAEVELPVGFVSPFTSRNISEFWRRWNITLSAFFRDYFLYNRYGFSRPNMYVNIFMSFMICGAFHILNWEWIMWGVVQAAAICAYTLYAKHLAPRIALPRSPAFGTTLTYLFICSSYDLPSRLCKLLGLI